jgi:hypothetical protein
MCDKERCDACQHCGFHGGNHDPDCPLSDSGYDTSWGEYRPGDYYIRGGDIPDATMKSIELMDSELAI